MQPLNINLSCSTTKYFFLSESEREKHTLQNVELLLRTASLNAFILGLAVVRKLVKKTQWLLEINSSEFTAILRVGMLEHYSSTYG